MKRIITPIVILTALFLILIGCETGGSVVKLGEAPGGYTTLDHEGISLRLSYLNQKDLYALYSQSNNPFVNYETGRLIVIETAVLSDAYLRLELENAQLKTPGGERGPTPKEDVYDYWYSRLIKNYSAGGGKGSSQYHNWSLKVTTEIIEQTILPGKVDVQAGSETVGYILFDQIRGEKNVDATFTLPVYNDQGELLHEFEYSFPI